MNIIDKLDDLIIQATKERSHYYVKSVCEEAKAALAAAEERCRELEGEIKRMREHTWCAYCGLEIHIDDEAATKISEHIMSCERHPIHIALADNAALRERLRVVEEACKDAARTMRTYGTANMGFSIDRCEQAIKQAWEGKG